MIQRGQLLCKKREGQEHNNFYFVLEDVFRRDEQFSALDLIQGRKTTLNVNTGGYCRTTFKSFAAELLNNENRLRIIETTRAAHYRTGDFVIKKEVTNTNNPIAFNPTPVSRTLNLVVGISRRDSIIDLYDLNRGFFSVLEIKDFEKDYQVPCRTSVLKTILISY